MQIIKSIFKRERSADYVQAIKDKFKNYFTSLRYVEHKSVSICSGIDSSVRFIGSHISVFKQYLTNGIIPARGYFIIQDCLRTRNSKYLFDDEYLAVWASYFPSFGIIIPLESLNNIITHVFNFLLDDLNIPIKNIRIRINQNDNDLFSAINNYPRLNKDNLEINSQPKEYYTHKIGLNNIRGRNFNIALRDGNASTFSDIGNIIILEDDKKKICVEVALGITTIAKQIFKLNYVLDCFPILGIDFTNEKVKRKFEDAIIVSVRLFREGSKPLGSNNRDRLFRTYLRSLSYFRNKTNISLGTLEQIISQFELKEFPDEKKRQSKKIISYILQYEKELANKIELSEEDKKILNALNLNLTQQK